MALPIDTRAVEPQQHWESYDEAIPEVPREIWEKIFTPLAETKLVSLSRTCKQLYVIASPLIRILDQVFGKSKWERYFGDVGVEPALPDNIIEILKSPCPFWPGKKIEETHVVTLIPQTVNGQPLTLKSLGELVKAPKQGFRTLFDTFELGEYTDPPAPAAHWALLTRDLIPGSHSQDFDEQQALVADYALKAGITYQVPNVLDTAVAIFMEHVQFGTRQMYGDNPFAFTRCQEKYNLKHGWKLKLGGFMPSGLRIILRGVVPKFLGVGAQRKF